MNIFGFDRFSSNARNILTEAQGIAGNNSGVIGTEHILLAILMNKNCLANSMLESFGVDHDRAELAMNFMPQFNNIYTNKKSVNINEEVKKALEAAILTAKRFNHFYLGSEHLLLGILADPSFKAFQIIQNIDVNPDSIKKQLIELLQNAPQQDIEMMGETSGMGPDNQNKKKSMLAQYSIDLTAEAENNRFDPVIGRTTEIERIIHILSRRTKNNPVLIGDPGVGKTAIVEGLALKIIKGEVPIKLKNKKIYSLDLGSMIAGTKFRGEFEDRLKKLINEVEKDRDAILFIDEIHTIIGAGAAEGSMDASNMLKPALSRGKITCIGATTIEEYRKNIEKDAAFERRFQPVVIEEPTVADTIEILKGIAQNYEDFHQVVIEPEAVMIAAKLSHRYIADRFLPDKAIDLIDEAASGVVIKEKIGESAEIKKLEIKLKTTIEGKNKAIAEQAYELAAQLRDQENFIIEEIEKKRKEKNDIPREKRKIVTKEDIARVVNTWTGIPVSKLIESDYDKFSNIENILKKKIIGQDEAIEVIAKAIKRSRAGIGNPRRPIGSFIFLGPTGVGKTELAKVLASEVYESDNALIKIDMSEFMEKHNVSRLVGAPAGYVGYEDGGKLTEAVRKKPYSIILFDEIEKAHPEVFNLLLQILEDGVLTDAKGRKVDFRNTIIIMTSNIGANELTRSAALGFKIEDNDSVEIQNLASNNTDYEKMKDIVLEQVKRKFNPEFLNRIDKVVVFKPLGKKEIAKIVEINLAELKLRLKNEKGITLEITKKAIDWISKNGFDAEFGARPIRRLIENEVENQIAEKIVSGEIEEGEKVSMDLKNDKIVFVEKKVSVRK
ncbi:MAG TPA: ATP-dependent Clp protease ATP-binding subunit [Patescibacteria group bacterium]|nr:ATP-dependent Clp protease ATP-binding subunit [Patescibacteria group bacterium]